MRNADFGFVKTKACSILQVAIRNQKSAVVFTPLLQWSEFVNHRIDYSISRSD